PDRAVRENHPELEGGRFSGADRLMSDPNEVFPIPRVDPGDESIEVRFAGRRRKSQNPELLVRPESVVGAEIRLPMTEMGDPLRPRHSFLAQADPLLGASSLMELTHAAAQRLKPGDHRFIPRLSMVGKEDHGPEDTFFQGKGEAEGGAGAMGIDRLGRQGTEVFR